MKSSFTAIINIKKLTHLIKIQLMVLSGYNDFLELTLLTFGSIGSLAFTNIVVLERGFIPFPYSH